MQERKVGDSVGLIEILGRNKTAILAGLLLGCGVANPVLGAVGLGIGIHGAARRHGEQSGRDLASLGDVISRAVHSNSDDR